MGIQTGSCFSSNCDCLPGALCTTSEGLTGELSLVGGQTLTLKGYGLDSATGHIYFDNQECTGLAVYSSDPNLSIGDPPVRAPDTYTCTTPAFQGGGAKLFRLRNGGGSFSGERSVTVAESSWGNGQDGALSVGSSPYYLDSSAAPAHSRTMVQFARVTALDSINPHRITLETSMNLAAGDELLWHVSAASSASACGASDLLPGYYGTGYVKAVNGTTVYLTSPVTEHPHQVASSALAATSRAVGETFCDIQVVRVPNLSGAATTGAYSVTLSQAFNYGLGYGGILPMRVSGSLALSGASFIQVPGLGFEGGAGAVGRPGQGASGQSVAASSQLRNGAGGAGGGPGQGGAGGGGGVFGLLNASSASGQAVGATQGGTHGAGACGRDACFLFGGGGGASVSSIAGGAGGGAALLFAHTWVSPGAAAYLTANGTAGSASGQGGGGGAGGVVYLSVQQASGGWSTLSAFANGLNHGSAGGDGAGGTVVIRSLQSTPTGITTSVVGGAGGEAGVVSIQ